MQSFVRLADNVKIIGGASVVSQTVVQVLDQQGVLATLKASCRHILQEAVCFDWKPKAYLTKVCRHSCELVCLLWWMAKASQAVRQVPMFSPAYARTSRPFKQRRAACRS